MSKEQEILNKKVEYDSIPVIDETHILNVYLVYGPNRKDSVLFHINYPSEGYIKSLKIINTKTGVIGCSTMKSVFNEKDNTMVDSYFLTINNPEHLLLSVVDLRLLMDINYRLYANYRCKTTTVADGYKEALKKAIKTNLMKLVNKFKATCNDVVEDYSVLYAMESIGVVDYIYNSSLKMDRSTLIQMLSHQNLLLKELI